MGGTDVFAGSPHRNDIFFGPTSLTVSLVFTACSWQASVFDVVVNDI